MDLGTYFDSELGSLVPNTLKVLKERYDSFKLACQTSEDKNSKNHGQGNANALSKSLLAHLDHILLSMEANEPHFARFIAMKACVLHEAGLHMKNSNINVAIPLLRNAQVLLWPLLPKSEVYLLYFINVYNYAILLKKKDYDELAIHALEEAIEIYDTRTKPVVLFTCRSLFSLYFKLQPNKTVISVLEDTITKIHHALISLYLKIADPLKYIKCEFFLLKREFEKNTFVPIEWIERAVIIAKLLVTQYDFRNSRHHLAMATTQFKKFAAKPSPTVTEKLNIQEMEISLSCAWIKYALMLLLASKETILAKYGCGDATIYSKQENETITEAQKNATKKIDDGVRVVIDEEISESDDTSNDIERRLFSPNIQNSNRNPIDEISDNTRLFKPADDRSDILLELEDSTIIDKALLLYPQDTYVQNLSDALKKSFFVDLRFPGQTTKDIEDKIPRALIATPKEAADMFIFLLPWIDIMKKAINASPKPIRYVYSILDLNNLFKAMAFFQPEPKQQYELHKDRQIELERLAWLLKLDTSGKYLQVELEVTKELSVVHYQLTQMNLNRVKELEEEDAALKTEPSDLFKDLLSTTNKEIV